MSVNHEFSHKLLDENYTYKKLFEEHEGIENIIAELRVHPSVDRSELVELKKMKLRVVDQMMAIQSLQ